LHGGRDKLAGSIPGWAYTLLMDESWCWLQERTPHHLLMRCKQEVHIEGSTMKLVGQGTSSSPDPNCSFSGIGPCFLLLYGDSRKVAERSTIADVKINQKPTKQTAIKEASFL